jgi:transcriptional regulator with XRE-family HTH domain
MEGNVTAKPKQTAPAGASDADAASGHLSRRVAELRRKAGWSLEQLSAACGVSRSMLSQIERHKVNPTLVVALRIAQAFGTSLSDLLDMPGASPAIEVIRAGDRAYHFRREGSCRIRTLSPLHLEKSVEFYEITLRPGGVLSSEPHFAGTSEILTVQQGTVRVRSGKETCELKAGDSAHYAADATHAIENTGRGEAVAFLVDVYRS